MPHWKALRYGKDDSRGLTYGSTLNIHQGILKSGNLQHKFVDSQFGTTAQWLLGIENPNGLFQPSIQKSRN